jgi:hypothetical protein
MLGAPRRFALLACGVLGACGGSDGARSEVVVADATLGGAPPVVIGASASAVMYTSSPAAGMTVIGGASLATLPAQGQELATASGPVAPAGDYVVFAGGGRISRVTLGGMPERIVAVNPEALGGNAAVPPVSAWTSAAVVSWGVDSAEMTATLNRVDSCDHARVTAHNIYVAAIGSGERRLVRIDQTTAAVMGVTSSTTWAPMFPGGGMAGSTYAGRIVDATDDGALWLVEEMPSKRALLIDAPAQGQAAVLLEHVANASGFFASGDALYWQEGSELLTAPRTGGAASIIASLPGAAGAVADGYVYYVSGSAIERLSVD